MFSFDRRRKAMEMAAHIRRICDRTTPNMGSEFRRATNRCNRSIPVLVCPWERGPCVDQCRLGITSDLCGQGAGLILTHPIRLGPLCLAIWLDEPDMEEPWFFLGEVVRCAPIGGGFWAVGVELSEFANPNYRAKLAGLLPPASKLRRLELEAEEEAEVEFSL